MRNNSWERLAVVFHILKEEKESMINSEQANYVSNNMIVVD